MDYVVVRDFLFVLD